MECCVCWETLPSRLHGASFSMNNHCRPDHNLCTKCYSHCTSCPLCRFHPIEKPRIYAEQELDHLRECKNNIINKKNGHNEYTHIINQMDQIKCIINSFSI